MLYISHMHLCCSVAVCRPRNAVPLRRPQPLQAQHDRAILQGQTTHTASTQILAFVVAVVQDVHAWLTADKENVAAMSVLRVSLTPTHAHLHCFLLLCCSPLLLSLLCPSQPLQGREG